MRIKLTLAMAVGLMFCTLATMELPELIKLVDDTSNDFSLVVIAKDALKIVKIQILPPGQPVFADFQRRQAALCFPTHPLIHTFQTPGEVLHVFCVLRT